MANGADATASGVSAATPLLRTHTPMRSREFEIAGVHANVLPTALSRPTFPARRSSALYLYWSGAAPPVAVAVHVITVPGACGAVLSAATVTAVTRGC